MNKKLISLLKALHGDDGTLSVADEEQRGLARGVAWARVSTDEQKRKGLSIPQQLREIRAFAERRGVQIVAEFSEASSAFRPQSRRPRFHRMLTTVANDPTLKVILVHDYSRFSRDSLSAGMLIQELQRTGIRVLSVSEPPLDCPTSIGVFVQAITLAKNEAFSRDISFHTSKGARANVQTRDPVTGWCYKNGGMPPWGYRAVLVNRGAKDGPMVWKRIWELDSTEVQERAVHEWVRHCLVDVAGRGATIRDLCEFCTTHNLPRRRGGPWYRSIWRDLLGPASLLQYCGLAVWGRCDGRSSRPRPIEEWTIVPEAHPAIISVEEAHRLGIVSRSPRARGIYRNLTRDDCARHLLSDGIFRCLHCGRPMVASRRGRYACSTRVRSIGEGCPQSPFVRREAVEGRIQTGLSKVLASFHEDASLLDMANRELAVAFADSESRAGGPPRGSSPSLDSAPYSAAPLTAPSGVVGNHGPDLVSRLAEAPRLMAEALVRRARADFETLNSGAPGQCKLVAMRWIERVALSEKTRRLMVQFRFPDEVTNPAGLGSWCLRHSPALGRVMRKWWTLPAEEVQVVSRRRRATG
jgi:hypothetical protein